MTFINKKVFNFIVIINTVTKKKKFNGIIHIIRS